MVLLLAMPAVAEPTPEELARAHYVSAQSYYRQGRVGDALREFQEAYRIAPRPAFHYNIAICQEKLGQEEAAIVSYQRYLAEAPDAEDRAAVEEHVSLLRARHPLPPPPPVLTPPPEPAAVSPAPAPVAIVAAAPPPEKPRRTWVWGLVGGGVALITVAVIVGAVVGTRSSDSLHTLPSVTVH